MHIMWVGGGTNLATSSANRSAKDAIEKCVSARLAVDS